MWDDIIGPSISVIPGHQLPQVRAILQRYRALRIEQPKEDTHALAIKISQEVKAIWDRARVPTVEQKNCVSRINTVIERWKSIHNPGEAVKFEVDAFLDLAPRRRGRGKATEEAQLEHLKSIMRQASQMKRRKSDLEDKYDWEVDFEFYLDQAKVNI